MHRLLAYRDPIALLLQGLFYIGLGLWVRWAFGPWLRRP